MILSEELYTRETPKVRLVPLPVDKSVRYTGRETLIALTIEGRHEPAVLAEPPG